jgi:hypothetical protein
MRPTTQLALVGANLRDLKGEIRGSLGAPRITRVSLPKSKVRSAPEAGTTNKADVHRRSP